MRSEELGLGSKSRAGDISAHCVNLSAHNHTRHTEPNGAYKKSKLDLAGNFLERERQNVRYETCAA